VSLFFFIYIMNVMELIPLLQFPVTSRIGFVWPLVFIVYFLYLYLGVKNQGAWGYLRNMIPPGVPAPIYIILVPVELLRFFVFQPFTLGVRLFGNMFAGHLLLTIFTIASWYLLSLSVGLVYAAGSFALAIFVFLLETLVTLLQAFIFTTLTATYMPAPWSRHIDRSVPTTHPAGRAAGTTSKGLNLCLLPLLSPLARPRSSASTPAPSDTASRPSARASASAWSSATRSRPWPGNRRPPAASRCTCGSASR
jgi:F0F1-type ATP synthase, subunit a